MTIPSREKSEFILRAINSGKYMVTPDGQIWNLSRKGSGRPALIKATPNHDGYPVVNLTDGVEMSSVLLHRVVALRYLPHEKIDDEVNHKDGDKGNAAVWNLEWISRTENVEHAYRAGLKARFNKKTGGFGSALSDDDVREIHRLRNAGATYGQIGSRFSLTNSAIYMIVKGKNHKSIFAEFHP